MWLIKTCDVASKNAFNPTTADSLVYTFLV